MLVVGMQAPPDLAEDTVRGHPPATLADFNDSAGGGWMSMIRKFGGGGEAELPPAPAPPSTRAQAQPFPPTPPSTPVAASSRLPPPPPAPSAAEVMMTGDWAEAVRMAGKGKTVFYKARLLAHCLSVGAMLSNVYVATLSLCSAPCSSCVAHSSCIPGGAALPTCLFEVRRLRSRSMPDICGINIEGRHCFSRV